MNRFRSPVKREGAERYLFITLGSFAASVVLTRLYLELAGYPQIGNETLHFAHALWGGLLLFIATLVPILFANRWVYTVTAVCGGIGVGLFIDEVGKFITQSNDYFFPFAIPIIYAFFLLVVLMLVEVRRPTRPDARTELYGALDQIMELIENDLDKTERAELEARLQRVIDNAQHPEHTRLAEALLAVVKSDTLHIVNPNPNLFQRLIQGVRDLEDHYLTEPRLKLLVIVGLVIAGAGALLELVLATAALIYPDLLEELISAVVVSGTLVRDPASFRWFLILLLLSGIAGVMMLLGGVLIFMRRERFGCGLGYLGLLVSLTMVNLLLFYFNQFAAVTTSIWVFTLLIVLGRYRRTFLGIGSPITVLSNLARKTPAKIAVQGDKG